MVRAGEAQQKYVGNQEKALGFRGEVSKGAQQEETEVLLS